MTVPKSQARKTTHDALLPNLIAKRDFCPMQGDDQDDTIRSSKIFSGGGHEMDQQCTLEVPSLGAGVRILRRAIDALAIGVLIGVLAGAPYDEMLGLSELLNTVVQSMISMFAFASLLSDWPTEIRVELQCIRQIG
jgi:hypothetical protein